MSDMAEVFARARDADIEAVSGVKLFRSGRRLRGECPLCGASKGKKADGAFSVDPQARVFKCWGCDAGGDVIDLERELRGGTPREAAERLAGGVISIPVGPRSPSTRQGPSAPDPTRPVGLSGPERTARRIFVGCRPEPIGETPAARYLAGRGLGPVVIAGLACRVFFNPAASWGRIEGREDWIDLPAMVARVRTPGGLTGGVHVTYLAADGTRKTALDPAKRMWGPQRDADGRPGGVWLTPYTGPGPLVVGEGIESTLAAMELHGSPCRGVATLSLGALQGGWLTDRFGRVDAACVAADPERPAFTWPDQDQVLIAVDRDMKPIRRKARKLGGGTVEVELDAEARARICAGLAVQAWKAAGATRVSAIAPAAGRDFNDELRERVG